METETNYDQDKILSTGIILRNAREKLGLSQQAVAERLCLKVSTIRDIEEDKIPTNLSATFLRGYIRSYAKLMHISEEEILPVIENQASVKALTIAPMQSFSFRQIRKKHDHWLISLTWLILLITTSLTSVWWWKHYKTQKKMTEITVNHFTSGRKNIGNNTHIVPLLNNNHIFLDKTGKDADNEQFSLSSERRSKKDKYIIRSQKSEKNSVFSSLQEDSNIKKTEKIPNNSTITKNNIHLLDDQDFATTSIDNSNALAIKFIGDCWLEVTDATGKKLFKGLNHKDNELHLIGKEPYKIKIGSPSTIRIQYLGKPVDLSSFATVDQNKVLYLTLSAEQLVLQ